MENSIEIIFAIVLGVSFAGILILALIWLLVPLYQEANLGETEEVREPCPECGHDRTVTRRIPLSEVLRRRRSGSNRFAFATTLLLFLVCFSVISQAGESGSDARCHQVLEVPYDGSFLGAIRSMGTTDQIQAANDEVITRIQSHLDRQNK